MNETDVAVEQYAKAVELSRATPSCSSNLGEALQKKGGKGDEAIEHYRQALKLKPSSPRPR